MPRSVETLLRSVAVSAIAVSTLLAPVAACGGDDDAVALDAGCPPGSSCASRMDAGGRDAGGAGMDGGGGRDAGRPRDGGRVTPRDGGPDGGPIEPDGGPRTAASCFAGDFASMPPVAPDYDMFMPTVGSHCVGTNQQDIRDVERVVFLGDSVTVGTPPTLADDFYRSRLADMLVTRFGLAAPSALWKNVNPTDGVSVVRESGDFASCAKWGARTDDFLRDNTQIEDCFPVAERDKTTLVIITMGGNDLASITKDGTEGVPIATIWDSVRETVSLMEGAVRWFREPGRFPNGVYVVFANVFEFTDGTGDTTACPAASLAGFTDAWDDPTELARMVTWMSEQYLRIAVETGTDMIFLLEEFCGHGFEHDNPMAPCYRGPGTDQWFDLTCIHPNPTGHGHLADMFMSVVNE